MEKKYVKWSSIISLIFFVVTSASLMIYIISPWFISLVLGGPDCTGGSDLLTPSEGRGNLVSAISSLCATTQSFLSLTFILSLLAFGPIAFIAAAIASFDIFSDKAIGDEKIKWLAIIWLLAGFGSFIYYWFVRRKEP